MRVSRRSNGEFDFSRRAPVKLDARPSRPDEKRVDGIVVDPPTFSRNADGRLFRVEHDFAALTAACLAVLAPGGWLLASTNHRGVTPARFETLVQDGAALAGRRIQDLEWGRMPPDFTGAPYLKALWISV